MSLADNTKESLVKNGWYEHLAETLSSEKSEQLRQFLSVSYKERIVYPAKENIFRAIRTVPLDDVKVVIIGQDPYHGPDQANGLAFAVNKGHLRPPSLINIIRELEKDLSVKIDYADTTLEGWASQGVLLLNSILTVDAGAAASHRHKGWEEITDCIIKAISDHKNGVVFLLWGNYAKAKGQLIDRMKHAILEAGHPSPFSSHLFFGCKHFSKANEHLVRLAKGAIDWEKIE
jgi:uracil-DNA glycosylase